MCSCICIKSEIKVRKAIYKTQPQKNNTKLAYKNSTCGCACVCHCAHILCTFPFATLVCVCVCLYLYQEGNN